MHTINLLELNIYLRIKIKSINKSTNLGGEKWDKFILGDNILKAVNDFEKLHIYLIFKML